jgi:hypothetical protein
MSDMTQQTPEADKTTEHAGKATTVEVAEPTSDEVHACTMDAHDWVTKRNDHGDLYETCSHCGKQADWIPQHVPPSP